MTLPGVLCVGRVYCDLVFQGLTDTPKPGSEISANNLSLHAGGGAAISAHHFARLGHPTYLCASLPATPFSTVIQEQLGSSIDLVHCDIESEACPQVTVVLTGQMDRSFVTHRAGQALPANYLDSVKQLSNANTVSHLHIGELATLLDYPELLIQARSASWTISLDCAWDTVAMSSPDACSLIERVDVFMPNETEFHELKKMGVVEQSTPLLVIKKGAAGAQAVAKEGSVEVSASAVECVDATGAGDAFNAGFIHAWLQNQGLQACLQSGNRSGELTVQQFGGIVTQPKPMP